MRNMREDITCVFEGVAGVGAIFISNIRAAQNIQLLNKLGIKAIVSVIRDGVVQHSKQDVTDHLYVRADDVVAQDLSRHFQRTYQFIDSVRKKTNVLVHCYMGISRSATIVIAYLLKKYNYSLSNIIAMVKRRRNKINPNKGFLQQLKKQAEKMGLPVQQNNQLFQDLLRPKSQKKSKDNKRPFSSHLSDLKKNMAARHNYMNIITENQELIKTKSNLIKTPNEENQPVKLSRKTIQFDHNCKEPKQINQNQLVEKKTPASKTEMNLSKTLQKYRDKEIKQTKLENLQMKIQRFKSKILQSERRNQKRSSSEFNSTFKSSTLSKHDKQARNSYLLSLAQSGGTSNCLRRSGKYQPQQIFSHRF